MGLALAMLPPTACSDACNVQLCKQSTVKVADGEANPSILRTHSLSGVLQTTSASPVVQQMSLSYALWKEDPPYYHTFRDAQVC